MALTAGKKFVIGITGCLAVAMVAPIRCITTSEGKIDSFSKFTFGDNECNVVDTRVDFKDASSGKVIALDATEWAKKLCADKDATKLQADVDYTVQYEELLVNTLINFKKPEVVRISVAKPAAQ